MSINFLNKKENKIEMVYDDLYISNNTYIQSKYYELIYEMKKVLTDKEINIILLRTIYNYSFDDISKKLNIPLQSIASVYKRAIKKFNKGVM
jgi:DNA-directed RNA polymerase specialized sigma24 family protein